MLDHGNNSFVNCPIHSFNNVVFQIHNMINLPKTLNTIIFQTLNTLGGQYNQVYFAQYDNQRGYISIHLSFIYMISKEDTYEDKTM